MDGRVAPAQPAARPFVVGYVCEQLLLGPADLERTKDRLHEYAAAADFHLGSIYVEHDVDGRVGFQALMAAVERYDVRHVLVPGLAHVQPIGRESKKAHIEHFTQATVQVAGSP
ncbi:recombinase family protein [Kribbella sp. NPDC059898]|uniref:recombinase family protein n=1 Tax=Kribbella sp. NPDC059898 TaxID=3346995 RepID=UPI0036579527